MRTAIIGHTLRTLRSQWWAPQRIVAWQERELVRTMRHACTAVPFYRALGIAPQSITRGADLERFPVLRKRDLQAEPERFLADGLDTRALHSSRTSGSTGEPTLTYFDMDSWALCKYALKIRRTLAATAPWGRRCLIVSEQPPQQTAAYGRARPFGRGWATSWLYAERIVSLFEQVAAHRRVIAQFRPDMLYAFPSYLLELQRSYEEAGEPLPRIPLLFTSSELLTAAVRARLEPAFDARIFDVYGCTEFKEVAWQCARGHYHVNFESVYLEAGASIVISTLCNRAMPLLRLDTGDLGSLQTDARCPCGRQSPQLQIAMGRTGELLQLPSGRRISPYTLTTLLETLPGLHQYRICQDAPARLTIELATAESLGREELERCRLRLLDALGEAMEVAMQRVPGFERGPGGKHRVFVRR